MTDVRAEELYESAMMHLAGGDKPTAVLQLQQALMLKPDYDMAWNNRGNILLQLGHPFDAIMNFEKAIAINPYVGDFYSNKGAAYAALIKFDDAIECYDKALTLNPKLYTALTNKGDILNLKGKRDEAIVAYRKAIEYSPKYNDAHLHLGLALLEDGQLKEGWVEYEWRWKSGQLPPRGLVYPNWEGQSLEGKALLIYSEQGNGDCLQFIRYAPLIRKKYGGKVYVEVRPGLARLVNTLEGVDKILIFGDKLPDDVTYCIPMLSIPRIFGTDTEKDIPWFGPYLSSDKNREQSWLDHLGKLPASVLRIGVCWAGMSRPHNSAAYDVDLRRSMKLSDMSSLALVPGISWVSLQKGPPADQIKVPPRGMTIGDWTEEMDDFYDTAAMVSCLDLVITVDTAVAHLAGALGKPVWMLSRFDGCWRWMGSRADSPWYPTLRQFRQPAPGQWEPVMEEIAGELRKIVSQKSKKSNKGYQRYTGYQKLNIEPSAA